MSEKGQMNLAEIELQSYQEYQNMKYKVSYMVYRLRVLWPALDKISEYFHLIFSSLVVIFSIYIQLSVMWAVLLTIFMIQSIAVSSKNAAYRKEQKQLFKEKNEDYQKRLIESERQSF